VLTVQESELDAVTGMSGCGPAYMVIILEGSGWMVGVKMGLSRQVALQLAGANYDRNCQDDSGRQRAPRLT